MTAPIEKTKPHRNPKYLAWIRTKSCAMCVAQPPCEAAHVRKGAGAGISQKPSDYWAVPLCTRCHRKQHSVGEVTFWGWHPGARRHANYKEIFGTDMAIAYITILTALNQYSGLPVVKEGDLISTIRRMEKEIENARQ